LGRRRQDASETVQPYALGGRIAMKYGVGGLVAQVCERKQNGAMQAVKMKQ